MPNLLLNAAFCVFTAVVTDKYGDSSKFEAFVMYKAYFSWFGIQPVFFVIRRNLRHTTLSL
jgi:hypothetical protein